MMFFAPMRINSSTPMAVGGVPSPVQESKFAEDESGPILGIRPSESQGIIEPFDEISAAVVEAPEMISLRLIEIVLAGSMVTAALFAGFLRKCKK